MKRGWSGSRVLVRKRAFWPLFWPLSELDHGPNNHLSLTSLPEPCQSRAPRCNLIAPTRFNRIHTGQKNVGRQTGTAEHSGRLSQHCTSREDSGGGLSS